MTFKKKTTEKVFQNLLLYLQIRLFFGKTIYFRFVLKHIFEKVVSNRHFSWSFQPCLTLKVRFLETILENKWTQARFVLVDGCRIGWIRLVDFYSILYSLFCIQHPVSSILSYPVLSCPTQCELYGWRHCINSIAFYLWIIWFIDLF